MRRAQTSPPPNPRRETLRKLTNSAASVTRSSTRLAATVWVMATPLMLVNKQLYAASSALVFRSLKIGGDGFYGSRAAPAVQLWLVGGSPYVLGLSRRGRADAP